MPQDTGMANETMECEADAEAPMLGPAHGEHAILEAAPTVCKPQLLKQGHQQHSESPTVAVELQDDDSPPSTTIFDLPIEKTEKGFGMYFTKREAANGAVLLVVDGLVDGPSESDVTAEAASGESSEAKIHALHSLLQLGDVLIGINGAHCSGMDVAEIVGLLRTAPLGVNTLQFSRELTEPDLKSGLECEPQAARKSDASNLSITNSFFGALKKVKTKIKEGIEGDEELLQREQEEREQFERAWLAEFDRLKREYESRWETCTHSADEFCGLLYHSSDQQQQEYLLREYPLLMDAWKHANLSAASRHVRLDWPAARIAYDAPIDYCAPATGASESSSTAPAAIVRPVLAPPALHRALDALRGEFAWRRGDVLALTEHLETLGLVSCSDLADALETRGGRFEWSMQSLAFPRLTRAICRSLLGHARHLAKTE